MPKKGFYFVFTEKIINYETHSGGSLDPEMSGTDNWVRFHICNPQRLCCTSNKLTIVATINEYPYFPVDPTDECGKIPLKKFVPTSNGQAIELEHSGPVTVAFTYVNLFQEEETMLTCFETFGLPIVLVGGESRRVRLECVTTWIFPAPA